MNPAELRRHLAQYADGEPDPAVTKELEQILADNPEARAAVERWQSLRQAGQRALASAPVPAGLESRIRAGIRARSGVAGPRLLRFGAPGLAVAAVVLLAFTFWPRGASATSVDACDFAKIFRNCALRGHDTLHVRNGLSDKTVAQLRKENSYAGRVPDLTQAGYDLAGACTCSPSSEVRLVHAYFRNCENGSIVSSFSIDHPIHMCNHGNPCPCAQRGEHVYRFATDGPVTLICWSENGHSYVLACGKLTREQLVELAENTRDSIMNPPTQTPLALVP